MKNKIVLIEDNAEINRSLAYLLKDNGFDIETSDSGYDGIAKAANMSPDLILLDLIMPKVSGYEVLEKLKEHRELKEVPVIIFSNLSRKDNENLIGKTGAVDYFDKSDTSPEELIEKIKQFLQ